MKQTEFIKSYCTIIDQCHGQKKDLLWFATWMSSKSPYCEFPRMFQAFWRTNAIPDNKLSFKIFITQIFKIIITFLSLLFKSFYLNCRYFRKISNLKKVRKTPFTFFRTFQYHSNPGTIDPFWGSLLEDFKKANLPTLTIYEPSFSLFKCKIQITDKEIFLPYQIFISPIILTKALVCLILEFLRPSTFQGNFVIKNVDLNNFVNIQYKRDLLTSATFVNLVFYNLFKKVFKKFHIIKAYYPYENNPWEKMLVLAVKNHDPHLPLVGFQHASIPEGATNYFLSDYESHRCLHPSKIITVGEYTNILLKKLPHYREIEVISGCALRHTYLELLGIQKFPLKSKKWKALVTLDGTQETLIFLDFILSCTKVSMPNEMDVIIREHPNFAIPASYRRLMETASIGGDHMIVSSKELKVDLMVSDLLIYCGSTCSIEALALGRPLINFQTSEFNFDPLFDFHEFKWNVQRPEDLTDAIKDILALDPSEICQKQIAGQNFVKNYFSPCTKEHIKRFF